MNKYKLVVGGSPIGTIELEESPRHGDILEFMGKKIFTYHTKGNKKKAIFGRYAEV